MVSAPACPVTLTWVERTFWNKKRWYSEMAQERLRNSSKNGRGTLEPVASASPIGYPLSWEVPMVSDKVPRRAGPASTCARAPQHKKSLLTLKFSHMCARDGDSNYCSIWVTQTIRVKHRYFRGSGNQENGNNLIYAGMFTSWLSAVNATKKRAYWQSVLFPC